MGEKPKKNGKGHRRPVEFVRHPDTGAPLDGLRFHKASGLYYRIEPKWAGEKRSRLTYYPTHGLAGVGYLRRAVFEHDCHLKGLAPTPAIEAIPIEHPLPIHDAAGDGRVVGALVVTLYDDAGNAKTVLPIKKPDLIRYFREVL